MSVSITRLEIENVKRVRAVGLTPTPTGLTVIGGDNCQGKTSILDAIAYGLGGERRRPTNLQRDGAAADARIEIDLSNGLTVIRKGKNAALQVTDPSGTKSGQRLLDAFVEELALDLPKFLAMSGKEKGLTLLRILGIEEQLAQLDKEERAAYDERAAQGRVAQSKRHHAEQLPEHHDVPDTPVSAADLVRESQAVMARNAERQAARNSLAKLEQAVTAARRDRDSAATTVERLRGELARAEERLQAAASAVEAASTALGDAEATPVAPDESTAEIEKRMAELEITNAKVRANLDKRKAMEDADAATAKYDRLTAAVEAVRARRSALLASVELPLPGLSVTDGELTYAGKAWDCMSSVEQIRAGVAIVRRLKPECGFVLLDGLERFDTEQLAELGAWLQAEGLQAIATRVSRGSECTIIIEDGLVVDDDTATAAVPETAEKSRDMEW